MTSIHTFHKCHFHPVVRTALRMARIDKGVRLLYVDTTSQGFLVYPCLLVDPFSL